MMQNPFSLSSYVCTITRVSADVDDDVHQSADSCFAASSIMEFLRELVKFFSRDSRISYCFGLDSDKRGKARALGNQAVLVFVLYFLNCSLPHRGEVLVR